MNAFHVGTFEFLVMNTAYSLGRNTTTSDKISEFLHFDNSFKGINMTTYWE